MRALSPQRRKVVVLSGALAATSGLIGAIGQHHHRLELVWIVLELALLVYILREFVVLKREG